MYSRKIGWLAALFLTGCLTHPTVTQTSATPETWQVFSSSSLAWMGTHMNSCMLNQPEADLVVIEAPLESFELQTGMIQFRWGAPEEWSGYSAILGVEELLIIVHPDNPLTELSVEQLRDIYTAKTTQWGSITQDLYEGEIQPWAYPSSEDTQLIFEKAIQTTQLSSQIYLAPDNEAMLQAIAANSNAIGFITGYWNNQSIQPVLVTDIDDQIRLNPILALSPDELHGAKLEWLLCLQEAIQPELHY